VTIFHLAHAVTSLLLSRCTVEYILIGSIFSVSLRPLQHSIKLYTQFKKMHVNINPTAFQDIKVFSQAAPGCGSPLGAPQTNAPGWTCCWDPRGTGGPSCSFHPSASTERVALPWLLGPYVGFISIWPVHTRCSRENRYPPTLI